MKRTTKWALAGTAVTATGILGWLALRMYVRKQVLVTLNAPPPEGYDYDNQMSKNILLQLGSSVLRIPSAVALAESMVPLWSTIHPYDAFDDILVRGRSSKYWPRGYSSALPKVLDNYIFATLKAMSDRAKQEEQKKLTG